MFIDFVYSLISLKPLNATNLNLVNKFLTTISRDMASKAYIFDPMDSPMLISADVSSIREFIMQYQEYKTVWAERVAEGVIAKTRKPKSVLRCTDPDHPQGEGGWGRCGG